MGQLNKFIKHSVILAVLSALLWLAGTAAALEPIGLLPLTYSGSFSWRTAEKEPPQEVHFNFDELAMLKGGRWELAGKGFYRIGSKMTAIEIRAEVNPAAGTIEIWEKDPDQPDFITNGSHRGRISKDYKRIKAVWTSRDTGQKGDLDLKSDH
jgi:hypothetical protein